MAADEAHRLMAIKQKLREQQSHIADLDKHMSVPRHARSTQRTIADKFK